MRMQHFVPAAFRLLVCHPALSTPGAAQQLQLQRDWSGPGPRSDGRFNPTAATPPGVDTGGGQWPGGVAAGAAALLLLLLFHDVVRYRVERICLHSVDFGLPQV